MTFGNTILNLLANNFAKILYTAPYKANRPKVFDLQSFCLLMNKGQKGSIQTFLKGAHSMEIIQSCQNIRINSIPTELEELHGKTIKTGVLSPLKPNTTPTTSSTSKGRSNHKASSSEIIENSNPSSKGRSQSSSVNKWL
jgi:hypothetical protein